MTRIIFGIQPVREAIRVHGDKLERLFVQQDGGPKLDALVRFAEGRGVTVQRASPSELDRRAAGGRHQGVLALAPELRLVSVDAIPITQEGEGLRPSLFVALDGVMDPQNFGAVIRSAIALGAGAILWPEHSSAPLTPATFRASAGAVEHALLCRVPALPEALLTLGERGVTAVALDAQADGELGALDLRGPVVIVIGAEDKGVRRVVRRACRYTARLPMAGPLDSLNASVAGALALYEVVRQRAARAAASTTGAMPPPPPPERETLE